MERNKIVIVWDPELVPPEVYAELIEAIGDLVRASGGVGIERIDDDQRDNSDE